MRFYLSCNYHPTNLHAIQHYEDNVAVTGWLLSAAAVSSVKLVKMRLLRMLFVDNGMLRESFLSVNGQRGRTSNSPSGTSLGDSQRPSRNLQEQPTT